MLAAGTEGSVGISEGSRFCCVVVGSTGAAGSVGCVAASPVVVLTVGVAAVVFSAADFFSL